MIKFKFSLVHAVALLFLLYLFRFYLIKSLLILIIPGLCIIALVRNYDSNKALMFSYPLSLILYLFTYYLLTRVGVAFNVFIYLLLPLVLLAYCVMKKKLSFSITKKFNFRDLIFVIIFFTLLTVVYSPYSFNEGSPRTGASNEILTISITRDGLLAGGVPSWSDSIYSGGHLYYTFPPLSYLSVAFLSVIETEALYLTYNLSYLFNLVLLFFSAYLLLRRLDLSPTASFLGIVSFLGIPQIAGELTFAGNVTSAFMYSLYPVAIYGFISLFGKDERTDYVIYGLSLSAFFLVYHYISYFMVIPALATLLIFIIAKRSKKLLINSLYYFGIASMIILSWLISYLLLSDNVILVGLEGAWNEPLRDFSEFLSYIASSNEDNMSHLVTLTPYFFWTGLISMLLFFRLKLEKKLKFKFSSDDLVFFTYSLLVFILVISELSPLHVYLPLRNNYYHVYRFWYVLIPLFAFSIARLFTNASTIDKRLGVGFAIFIIIFSLSNVFYTSTNINDWLSEPVMVNQGGYEPLYSLLSSVDGRVDVYGSFGPAIIPAVTYWSGASMYSGYNFQKYSTKLYYERTILPIKEASMDYLKEGVTTDLVHNIYQNSWTNLILFFNCTQKGFEALMNIYEPELFTPLASGSCIVLIEPLNKGDYAQMIVLSRVDTNNESLKDEVINRIMNERGGHSLVFTEGELDVEYSNIIPVSDYNLSHYDAHSMRVSFTRESDTEITLNASKGYLLVKEPYFPTWHAYQDGTALVTHPTYHGFTIIESLSDGEIKFVNEPYYSEYLGLIIYSVTLAVILFCLSRK